MLKKKLNKVDIGIAVRHIETALNEQGKKVKDIKILGNENKFQVEIYY